MGLAFSRLCFEQFVVPILRQNDIVVMDNLPSHKVAASRAVRQRHAAACSLLQPVQPRGPVSSNSKPYCEKPPPEPSKPSSRPSPKPSPKSVRKSAQTTSLTKAIAANYESALDGLCKATNRVF